MRLRSILAVVASSCMGVVVVQGCGTKPAPFEGGDDGSASSSSSSGSAGTTSGSSSSGGGGSSSSSSGNNSSSSGATSSSSGGGNGGSSSSSGGTSSASSTGSCADASAPQACGSTPACDLKTKTCCIGLDIQTLSVTGDCIDKTTACSMGTASFGCLSECDCSGGQVCCGNANSQSDTAQTSCATGTCSGTNTSTMGSAQICESDSECKNKMQCIKQSCKISATLPAANLTMCGLQSQKPFNCTAAQ